MVMNYLVLGALAWTAVLIVTAPEPGPALLMPEPRQSWLRRRRSRHEQETFEDTATIDWLVKVKLSGEDAPAGRHVRTVTFPPSAEASVIHRALSSQPPWETALAPRVQRETMTWPGGKSRPVHQYPRPAPTAGDLAEQQFRDSIDRALRPAGPPPPGTEPIFAELIGAPPGPEPEPEEPHAWQPGDPADTIVRGIRAITDEYLQDVPRYEDP